MLPVKNAPCRHLAPSRLVPQVPAWDIMHVWWHNINERKSKLWLRSLPESTFEEKQQCTHTHKKYISLLLVLQ